MKHYLSICAIFKDEAPYLDEWLRFYDKIGVEHFFLYNNDSADAYKPILAPWEMAGRITLYDVPTQAAQLGVYRHCIQTHARDSFWINFVDIDEYLFAPAHADLRRFLQAYESECGVVANWLMFGASGHQKPVPGLTMINYTRRCPADLCMFDRGLLKDPGLDLKNPDSYTKVCDHVKTIANTRHLFDISSTHTVFASTVDSYRSTLTVVL